MPLPWRLRLLTDPSALLRTSLQWITIALIWGLVAAAICIILPLWESKDQMMKILGNAFKLKTAESRDDAVAHTAHDILPPEDKVGVYDLKGVN